MLTDNWVEIEKKERIDKLFDHLINDESKVKVEIKFTESRGRKNRAVFSTIFVLTEGWNV